MGIARKTICCRRLRNSISGNMDELVSFARSIQVFGPICWSWTVGIVRKSAFPLL